jgi:hypothetical protein
MAVETTEKYCPICGKDVAEPTFKRFGEWACSEAHAEEQVKEVRAQRVRAASAASAPAPDEQSRRARQMCGG